MDRALLSALHIGDTDRVKALLEGGAVEARDGYGQTPLILAAVKGHGDIVDYLISRGAKLNVTAKHGMTPLMLASLNGHGDIVKSLLKAGADQSPVAKGAPGYFGKTAEDLAATPAIGTLFCRPKAR
ncbi:MAG: ankyrin repeat domain-containing protein [Magnetospiraceae bacterium]